MSAAEFMNAHPPTCAPDDTIASAANSVTQNRVRQLPVIENGAIIGIISTGDIVKERFEEMELERDTLRDLALSHQLVS
jgi:predicted transcriptional regulator